MSRQAGNRRLASNQSTNDVAFLSWHGMPPKLARNIGVGIILQLWHPAVRQNLIQFG